ncbi:MAG TPA: lipid-A-disaccharide synthase [Candidatus Omnitrophota bacterium]|nr:lipid-A-disaccharide synthase [Candidatus Omnitrophota bacterium]
MEKPKNILIVAGEASGDQHAAMLVREIRARMPETRFFGLGGEQMQREGVLLRADIVKLAVIGFLEVLKHIKQLRALFHALLEDADRSKPDAAILVDYPGFNLRLAKELHRRGIPVIYYISPQIWAWGAGRIDLIKRTIKLMIVFFPFEETLYERHGVRVAFVGHPLLEQVDSRLSSLPIPSTGSITSETGPQTIALLPGSRLKEVKALLPVMLESAALLNKRYPGRFRFRVMAAATVPRRLFEEQINGAAAPVDIVDGMDCAAIRASAFALVCSGTATLETALIGTPLAVLYKVNLLTWFFVRLMIRIPYIALVNVVRGEKIVEEFVQFSARAPLIADYLSRVLNDPAELRRCKLELETVRKLLGAHGASQRAAEAVIACLRSL